MIRYFRFLFIFFFLLSGLLMNGARPVLAAAYDIKEMTPEIKSALESRRARFDEVRAYKDQGVIGENNQGYLELLSEDAGAKTLVQAENNDRRLIYKAIVEQNNLAESELERVEKAFAQVQRDKATAGDKIQNSDGQWVSK